MLGLLESHLLGGGLAWLNLIRGSGPTSGPPWNFSPGSSHETVLSPEIPKSGIEDGSCA